MARTSRLTAILRRVLPVLAVAMLLAAALVLANDAAGGESRLGAWYPWMLGASVFALVVLVAMIAQRLLRLRREMRANAPGARLNRRVLAMLILLALPPVCVVYGFALNFLDATIDTLVRRFSETRRRHPLSHDDLQQGRRALVQIIELERELLAELREQSHVIDTSTIRASQLQSYVKSLLVTSRGQMTLVFQSFAFKRGIPMDADYVFDVRMLPNPHYEPSLRELTGLDEPVADFLRQQPDVSLMQAHIEQFLAHWLEMLDRNHRSYVTVAVGCTGGQQRSVYLVERLAAVLSSRWATLKRHRELDGR